MAVILLGALIALVVGGRKPLEARTAASLATGPVTVEIVWPAVAAKDENGETISRTWIPLDWQVRLLSDARAILGESRNPLDPTALSELSHCLASTGWFEGPPTVRCENGSNVIVSGVWRTPAAVVRQGSDDVWISWDGKVMPNVAPAASVNARVIVGPTQQPAKLADGSIDFGTPWPGDDLAAGLELLGVTASQPWFAQVAGVDVSKHAEDGSLSILTTYGTRIAFGGRPSKPRYGDAPTNDKLRLIATLFHDTRRIDGGHPAVYVDLPFLMFDRSATAELIRQQNTERLARESDRPAPGMIADGRTTIPASLTTPEVPPPQSPGAAPGGESARPKRDATKPKASPSSGAAKKGSKPTTSKPVPSTGNGGGTRRA